MNALTSALQVLIKSIRYKCFGWPTIMLGIDSNGDPQPFGVSAPSGSGGGGLLTGVPTGTYITAHVAANGSLSGGIPITAKRWAVNFVGTGTGNTLGTNTGVTGGQSFSDNGTPAVALAVGCDSSTVADIIYSTT